MSDIYEWGGLSYPPFYPATDDRAGIDRYQVELSVVCYPYSRSSGFDIDAFPKELRGRGYDGNTQFVFLAHDPVNGFELADMDYEDAVRIADELNEAYAETILDCSDNWNWNLLDYEICMEDLVYSK